MHSNKNNRIVMWLLIALSLFIFMITVPKTSITSIFLTGGGNPKGEIWVTKIEIDGQKENLKHFKVAGNWHYIEGSIVYTPVDGASEESNTLKLDFKNAESVKLTFLKHNWSGSVEISDGDRETQLNLWTQSGDSVDYVKTVHPFEIEPVSLCLSIISLLVFLGVLCYIEKKGMFYEDSKAVRYNYIILFISAFILDRVALCKISDIKYILFFLLALYGLFIKNKDTWNYKMFFILVFGSYLYSIYYSQNTYLPEPGFVLVYFLILLLFYSFAPGHGRKECEWLVKLLLPILVFFMTECISNTNIMRLRPMMIIAGAVFTAIYLFVMASIIQIKNAGLYLGITLLFLISTINHYIITFKKYAFTFGDLLQARTGLAVAGAYKYTLSDGIIFGILMLIGLFSLIWYYIPEKKIDLKVRLRYITAGIVVACISAFGLKNGSFENFFHIGWNNWETAKTYSENGFLISFITSAQRMMIEKPEGYSVTAANDILNSYKNGNITETAEEKPVIIAIMNESFSDLADLGSLGETEDVMSYWKSLDSFIEKGKTFVSVRGGGTCNSEFEFLTGNSMEQFKDLYPYTQYNFSKVPSLTKILKEQGYHTIAMHPAFPENYRRKGVYQEMGFDEFYSYDTYKDYEKVFLDRTSDLDDYEEILQQVKKNANEPLFIFNVTIQNHGDYDIDQFNEKYERITMDPDLEQFKSAQMYLSLIKESNKALQYLLEELKKIDRPVILCMFGDHQPGCLSEEFENQIFKWDDSKSELANRERYYMTPYLIWSNYKERETESDATEMITSPNYLAAKILNYAGLQTTDYSNFLLEMQKNVLAINRFGYFGSDEKWHSFDEKTEYETWIHDYRILQYYQVIQNQ